MRRQLLRQDSRLYVTVWPDTTQKLDNPCGTDILRVHLVHHATDGATPGGNPHQIVRAQARFNIVRRRATNRVLYLRVSRVVPHIHHNGLANAVLIFQRLLQRDEDIGWLDDGDFDQPLFLAAR
jgi:hypothetical protein